MNRRSVWLYATMTILLVAILAAVAFTHVLGTRMASRYPRQADALSTVQVQTTAAHLWFEEAISGDPDTDLNSIYTRLDDALRTTRAVLDGGNLQTGPAKPETDPELRVHLQDTLELLSQLRRTVAERWERRAEAGAGIGSDLDQRFDELFDRFLATSYAADSRLQQLLREDLTRFRRTQALILGGIAILALLAALALHRYVAERNAARRQAAAREEDLATTLMSIGDAVISTDTEGRVTRMNRVAEHLTGWPLDEARGIPLDQVFVITNGQTGRSVDSPVRRVLRDGCVVGLANDTILTARDGTTRPIADSGAPIHSPDGTVRGVVLVFRDVSEYYAEERRLADSEARYRALFEHMHNGFALHEIVTDDNDKPIDYVFLEMNEAFTALTTLTPTGALGRRVTEVLPDIRQDPANWIERYGAIARGGSPEVFEDYSQALDRWYSVSAYSPAPGQFATIVADITDRKEEEQRLRAREARFRATIAAAPFPLMLHADDGEIVLINDEWTRVTGYRLADIPTIHDWTERAYGSRAAQTREAIASIHQADGPTADGEHVVRTATGEKRRWDFHSNSLGQLPDGRRLTLSMAVDITERRQLEESAHQSRKMEAIGQLAGGIAHDFNNQLAGIMGYADLLGRRLDDPDLRDFAANVLTGARRASDLTRQLLAFARKGHYRQVPVDLHQAIGEVVKILSHSLDKRITIRELLEAPSAITLGDPSQLQNALLNLALNARDAMPDGGQLSLETHTADLDEAISRDARFDLRPGAYVRVTVRDTGCGMDTATLSRIFEPFFTTKEPGKGTGMGLAAVYGTVRSHNGAVVVDSKPGEGSAFHVYLPLCDSAPAGTGEPAAVVTRGRARILVVEDEEMLRDLAKAMLTDLGYEVRTEPDGQAAVDYFRAHADEVDLVVLDLVMPRLGGYATFNALRQLKPSVRVLLASGYSIDGEAQELIDAGALGFLQKPFDEGELSRKVADALAR